MLGCALQWVDCVSQLLRMYPFAFEFSSVCVPKGHEKLNMSKNIMFK